LLRLRLAMTKCNIVEEGSKNWWTSNKYSKLYER